MEHKQFCNAWDRLCINYDCEINCAKRESYFKRLVKYSYPDVIYAIGVCIDNIKWFPKVAEIIDALPVKTKTADDWDQQTGVDEKNRGYFAKTNKGVSQFTDEQILSLFKKRFPGWSQKSASNMLREARKGIHLVCEQIWLEHEQQSV